MVIIAGFFITRRQYNLHDKNQQLERINYLHQDELFRYYQNLDDEAFFWLN